MDYAQRSRVNEALQYWFNQLYATPPLYKNGNVIGGVVEVAPKLLTNEGNCNFLWAFYDAMAGKPWSTQCRDIAAVAGPTQHTVVLMWLAYMIFEGWAEYIHKNKHAPIDIGAYLKAGIIEMDLRELTKQEF